VVYLYDINEKILLKYVNILMWYAHVCNVNYVIKYLWLPTCWCIFVSILYMFNLSYLYLIFTYLCPQGKFCMKGENFLLAINFYETWIPLQSWHIKINISTQNRSKALTPKPCILWIQETHYATYFIFHSQRNQGGIGCKLQTLLLVDVSLGCLDWVVPSL
jgi:hypothetical protein